MTQAEQDERSGWFIPMAMLVAYAVLLLAGLGIMPLGNDEAAYAEKIARDWPYLYKWLAEDNYPPLYFICLKTWTDVAGLSEFALRITSWPFAVLTASAFILFFRRRLPEGFFVIALVIFLLSPLIVFLHRQGKYYAVFGFLAMLVTFLLWSLCEEEHRRGERITLGVIWCLASLTLLWIHYMAAAVWFGMGLWLLMRIIRSGAPEKRRRAMVMLGALAVTALGFLPQLTEVLRRAGENAGGDVVLVDGSLLRRIAAQLGYTAYAFGIGHSIEVGHLFMGILPAIFAMSMLTVGAWRLRVASTEHERLLRFLLIQAVLMGGTGYLILAIFLRGLPVLAIADRLGWVLPLLIPVAVWGWKGLSARVGMVAGPAYVFALAISLVSLFANIENNQWEYKIPWRKIVAEALLETRTTPHRNNDDSDSSVPWLEGTVLGDSWTLGSRPWYYFRDTGLSLEESRFGDWMGALRGGEEPIIVIRPTRDTSPDGVVSAMVAKIEAKYGKPVARYEYVEDSKSAAALKKLFRRGTDVETLQTKLRMDVYRTH